MRPISLLSTGRRGSLITRSFADERIDGRRSNRQRYNLSEHRQVDLRTFGELIPGETALVYPDYRIARGPIATVEIGVEVKILAKAMIKQIDRVINDLRNQVVQFKRGGGNPICVAVIGINQADSVVGYEGNRRFPTTGRAGFLHPFQEAPEAERRLLSEAKPEFDEFLALRFKATNAPPYPFEWVNIRETALDYAAALSRICARYQQRF